MSHINFKEDPLKHYVRKNGWLKAAKQQKQVIRRRSKRIPLRYFTFCAVEAIDVFMLELEGILKRSKQTGHLEGVYFCERDPVDYTRISNLLGLKAQGFLGKFEKIVLFEDDDDTRGKTRNDGNFYPEEVDKKLLYKDAHQRLREAFPFDIINLDVCGAMFPPRKNIMNPLLKSIIQILDWQTNSKFPINNLECKQFTLFLTSHINSADRTNQKAIQQLTDLVIDNINTNPNFQGAFVNRYSHNQVQKLVSENFPEFICLAIPKLMIKRALLDFGWEVDHGETYLFHRDDRREDNEQYQIMHTTSVYKRISDSSEQLDVFKMEQYFQSVTQLVNDGIQWIDSIVENPNIKQELEEDLIQIVKFRDQRNNL